MIYVKLRLEWLECTCRVRGRSTSTLYSARNQKSCFPSDDVVKQKRERRKRRHRGLIRPPSAEKETGHKLNLAKNKTKTRKKTVLSTARAQRMYKNFMHTSKYVQTHQSLGNLMPSSLDIGTRRSSWLEMVMVMVMV